MALLNEAREALGDRNDPLLARVLGQPATELERIAEHDSQLGRRLKADVRAGTFCVYAPPPGAEPAWDLSGPI